MHLVVHGDFFEHFCASKDKILNSFVTYMFSHSYHKLQDDYVSNGFFFLPSTAKLNINSTRTMQIVKLNEVNDDSKNFSEKFDPSVLNVFNLERAEARLSVLKLLKEMADFSSENLKAYAENISLCC